MKKFKLILSAFANAGRGIKTCFQSERNFRIQIILFVLAVSFGLFFGLTNTEWCLILIVSGAVFAGELFNTALEKLCDFVEPKWDERIKQIKDVSAGANLILSLVALAIGGMIFGKILYYFFTNL
ncbi:MAG: diacylglycerol kinase [Psychromonas sp.]|jgi:diacylglycerol kinase